MATATAGASSTMLNWATGVAVDPTTGKLFVADYNNSRVLRFASAVALTSGAGAEAVLGQPDFIQHASNRGGGVGRNTMNNPSRVFVDANGRLWVTDSSNNRVLWFNHASFRNNGADADGVLGQQDFAHDAANRGSASPTANSLYDPEFAMVDASGKLWIADANNSRVLRFDDAVGLTIGAAADGVLGQANLTSGSANRGGSVGPNTLNRPWGVLLDTTGRLWVADTSNQRVLRFDNAASKVDGADADGVLGQADFTHNGGATTQSGVWWPANVTIDNDGRLYVSNTSINRVLIYNNAASKANGADADNVFGQPNFTTGSASTSATKMNSPEGVFYDLRANVLWVADRDNNRVLRFADPSYYLNLPLLSR
jgi:DNA-binding beta-propeller fold protein YncE